MAKKEFDTKHGLFANAIPKDFSFETYAALKREDFMHDGIFFMHRAAYYQYQADAMTLRAEEYNKFGSKSDQRKAKKLVALYKKMSALKKELEGKNVPINPDHGD